MASFDDLWQRFYDYTGKASENVRNSAIAGLAAVWLFSGSDKNGLGALHTAPSLLLLAGGFFAASLGLDILHYFVAAQTVKAFTEAQEREHDGPDPDAEIELPHDWMRWPTWLYRCKVFALFIGYVLMSAVLLHFAL